MRVLVTGGAGFIGSHIVRGLLARGDHVRVVDNFSTGKRENLADLRSRLEVIEADLRDAARMLEAVRGVDAVFHEGAFVSNPDSLNDPQACFNVNVAGTVNLLEAARTARVPRLVIASSAAVYGDSEALPQTETGPIAPGSPYALSKRTNEMYAQLFTAVYGLEVAALRYFNVYGSRQRPDSMYAAAVPIFTRKMLAGKPVTIFGDGGQTRDLIHVQDVVHANLLAAEHAGAPGEIFNVCTGVETRLLDLVEVLVGMFPNAPDPEFAPPRPGDIYRSVGDPSKAARLLGFQSKASLQEGLQETVTWMRQMAAD